MNIFDIIGPVMTGPSSSHTAGAVRIGNAARLLFNKEPKEVIIKLFNSFSKTGKGHGTDKALIAGILGFAPDDKCIINAYKEAEKSGLTIKIDFAGENPLYHANTAQIIVLGENEKLEVIGKSIGGGRIVITKIDGYDTEYTGEYNGVLTVHRDVPGVVTEITSYLAEEDVNIAFMRVHRRTKGSKALMIIETDNPISDKVAGIIEKCPHVEKAIILKER